MIETDSTDERPDMPGFATLAMINLDAEDPAALAAFYSQVLGWEVQHSQDEYAMIGDGSTSIGFGKVPGYSGPGWPGESTPKRFHLDFYVDDLDKAEEQALALGATSPSEQPQPNRWRVLLDPAGHPFDVCLRS
ncbi:VOC family protein [Winogradskya humida]|nr:VOC family protein [Actinoplanes humidus]